MYWKRNTYLHRAVFLAAGVFLSGHPVHAQAPLPADGSQYGWLEGTVTNNQGQAVRRSGYLEGVHVRARSQTGAETETTADTEMGGLYSFHNLKPGVYDIILPKGQIVNTFYCPERIWGVVVKPGQRTVLNIIMDQGETYEEIGKPNLPTSPATNATMELDRLQKQVDDLRQQLAALLAKMPAGAPPAAPTAATAPVTKP